MSLLDTFFNGQVLLSSLPALLRGFINTLLLGLRASPLACLQDC